MRTYTIPNCPLTGFARQVRVVSNAEVGQSIRLQCAVDYLDGQGQVIERAGIGSYEVLLVADNDTKVAANGQIDPQGTIGEYDWIVGAIEAKIVTPRQVEAAAVAARAADGRFDR